MLSEEAMEWIGLKKSEYLSKLITHLVEEDLGFEQFPRFDSYIPQTLEKPDRSFQYTEDKQEVRVYVRTIEVGETVHQVVIGAVFPHQGKEIFVPILSFVTRMDDLVNLFSVGTPLSAPTLN